MTRSKPWTSRLSFRLIVNHHSATPYLIARNDLYEFDTVGLLRGLYIQSFQDFFLFWGYCRSVGLEIRTMKIESPLSNYQ